MTTDLRVGFVLVCVGTWRNVGAGRRGTAAAAAAAATEAPYCK